jgi:hypothetical protein
MFMEILQVFRTAFHEKIKDDAKMYKKYED